MESIFEDLKSEAAFRYFEEISAIPRPSRYEKEVADYIERFATERGLYCYRDEAHNVLVKKSATPGRKGEATVLLQAHTDMVAEKHAHIKHDFLRDGIKLHREGNCLFAAGTTLGADDGFGVAIMLAVLDGAAKSHPDIECLFTSAEEGGLVGANAFDYTHLSARYMLNLDSAEEDTVIVGCCGGIHSSMEVPVQFETVQGNGYVLSIGGLCGGHSGEDVHRNRLNANVLMGKLLLALAEHTPFRIAHITGGDKSNAIPRECEVMLLPRDFEAAARFLAGAEAFVKGFVLAKEDQALFLKVQEIDVSRALSYLDTDKILKILQIRNGVLYKSKTSPEKPETSRNLASFRTGEDHILVQLSSRSPREERLDELWQEERALALDIGAHLTEKSRYPGWESDKDSTLVRTWQKAMRNALGTVPTPTVIHAGLETGVITNAVAGLEAIAIGPNLHDLHTPFETMEIDSFLRITRAVIEFLRVVNH